MMDFVDLARTCAQLTDPTTVYAVVSVESTFNPYAIGVVDGYLVRQPRNLSEAIATAKSLEEKGFNYSVGLGQVNKKNFAKYGLSIETAFSPCSNLKAADSILVDCFIRARKTRQRQVALRAAFSCYYSGNFLRGYKPDRAGDLSYVDKVVQKALSHQPAVKLRID